jgi:hypothetical protein
MWENGFGAADAGQTRAKQRGLHTVNRQFERVFNDAAATQTVFQQAARSAC